MMKNDYTAIITKDEDWWLGWIEEIPGANAQEKTREELLISLKEAAKDIIELRREQFLTFLFRPYGTCHINRLLSIDILSLTGQSGKGHY
ncbi:type II toxin-antitoxin system HicB family antitoxin [Desulfococcaceae bacterium HSG9]|nr:type II toxin-antitoxin system HicB family antitoxin [Desulfococcaceae bacterium HSG9]